MTLETQPAEHKPDPSYPRLIDDLLGDTALIGAFAQLGDLDEVRRLSGTMHDCLLDLADILDRGEWT